jgi:hypothetical protein
VALARTKAFAHDDRRIWIQEVAALAIEGGGYREKGSPSRHCKIGASLCHIHIDRYGFVIKGPDGKTYYNPDVVQHIVDELGWATKVVPGVRKPPLLGNVFGVVLDIGQ